MPKADRWKVVRWQSTTGVQAGVDDELVVEEPLEVRVKGRAVSVTMRTPGDDEELAVGFLIGEAIVKSRQDIIAVEPCPHAREGNVVNVVLHPRTTVDFARLSRNVYVSSSCGVCGKASIEAVEQTFDELHIPPDVRVPAALLTTLPEKLRAGQQTFSRTGGLHAAAAFDLAGNLLCLREDVGRHNAVDKVVGHALLTGAFPYDRHILLVSGRASFEILQKSRAARFPIVAAVSAPSRLAAQFAKESGQTLIGFLREGRMNVYTGEDRVAF